ncbi:MAG: UbiA-like polyprenyltransferase [Candidatus Xenobia bacterium]
MKVLRNFFELVKFEHTIFALPFAYMGAMLGADGRPPLGRLFWITLAMVGARTAGMAFNRLVDRHIDARNPRTAQRTLPRGAMQPGTVVGLIALSLAALALAAWRLNPLCLKLSPVAMALLAVYSYLKRFTPFAHLGVGLVLACAPIGAWVSVRGTLDPSILPLGAGVMLWVAGFDILYACQDYDFDMQEGLHSIPQALGIPRALQIARGCHAGTLASLLLLGWLLHRGGWYFGGVLAVLGLLIYEHRIVRAHDLSRLNEAFFSVNGWISVTLCAATVADYLL